MKESGEVDSGSESSGGSVEPGQMTAVDHLNDYVQQVVKRTVDKLLGTPNVAPEVSENVKKLIEETVRSVVELKNDVDSPLNKHIKNIIEDYANENVFLRVKRDFVDASASNDYTEQITTFLQQLGFVIKNPADNSEFFENVHNSSIT
ncbi:hypothetical protein CYMTET_47296 [Cymbomonas tetramitiformis]|uniref:Uncharacterized protein n=1 Tax=Cymbomonas tetramitiformis TaxID=36881 RepID=A0AAE0BWG3_9CHLO|nr:hypothetical protein CYMTET_47296 [Cymbomonas tetramitiformis]